MIENKCHEWKSVCKNVKRHVVLIRVSYSSEAYYALNKCCQGCNEKETHQNAVKDNILFPHLKLVK